MSYRIDLNYDPYSGHIQVNYDDRMQNCIEELLSPELILAKWPSQQLPATLVKYKSYNDWEVVDNEFSRQWHDAEPKSNKRERDESAPASPSKRSKPDDCVASPSGMSSQQNSAHNSAHNSPLKSPLNSPHNSPYSVNSSDSDSEYAVDTTIDADKTMGSTPTSPQPEDKGSPMSSPTSSPMGSPVGSPMDPTGSTMPGPALPSSSNFGKLVHLLENLQQSACKPLCKELVRIWIPQKKSSYPYKCGDSSRPPCWPQGIPHHQPDHLPKHERMQLIAFILFQMPAESRIEAFNMVTSRSKLAPSKMEALIQLDGFLSRVCSD